jgi:hypothetical protein
VKAVDADVVVCEVYGHTGRQNGVVMLPADKKRRFFSKWCHLTSVVLLDLARGNLNGDLPILFSATELQI